MATEHGAMTAARRLGSDFVEMFVGVGASRVRDLFKEAKSQAPSIIFIDEIDAVGRQRGAGLGGGHDEREQTLNQLLVEMDGFEESESVILIAATNRPDILDPALLRPGRFDRQVTVDRPDVKGRERILRVHAENKPMDEDVKFEKLAQMTVGFTGADLANLLNESALLAARRHRSVISMDEVEESMERVIAGPQRKGRVMTEAERTTIAYHERTVTRPGGSHLGALRRRDAGRPELRDEPVEPRQDPNAPSALPPSMPIVRYAHPGRGERGNRPRGRHGFLRRCSRPGQEGLGPASPGLRARRDFPIST